MDSNMDVFYDVKIKRESDEALIKSLTNYDQMKLRKGELLLTTPFEMEIAEGSRLYDIVGFEDTSNFAISHKVHALFKEHNITGWKSFEIKIKDTNEKYYGLQVVGRCGRLEKPAKAGFYLGYKFDYNSWDKSDLFCPDETVLLFCTQRVKDIFEKNQISNLEILNIDKVRGYSVGR